MKLYIPFCCMLLLATSGTSSVKPTNFSETTNPQKTTESEGTTTTRPPFSTCHAPTPQVHDLMVQIDFVIQILTGGAELNRQEHLSADPRNQSTNSSFRRIQLCDGWRVSELESDLRRVMSNRWQQQQHSTCGSPVGGASPKREELLQQDREEVTSLVERLRKIHVFYGMYPQVTFDAYAERVDELERALFGIVNQVPTVPNDSTEVNGTLTTPVAPSINDVVSEKYQESSSKQPFDTFNATSEHTPVFPALLTTSVVSFVNSTVEATPELLEPSSVEESPNSTLQTSLWTYFRTNKTAPPPLHLIEAVSKASVKEASEAFHFAIKSSYPPCNGYDIFSSTRLDTMVNRIDRLMLELPSNISMLPYVALLEVVKTAPSPICTQDYVRIAHKVYLRSLIDSKERVQWMALRFRFNSGIFNLFSGRYCSLVTKSGMEVRPTNTRSLPDPNRHQIELGDYTHTTRRNQWRIHPVEQGRSFVFKSAYFDHRFFETTETYDWRAPGIYLHVLPEENSLAEFSRVFRFSLANSKWESGVTRTGKDEAPFMATRQLNQLTVFELICVGSGKEHLPVPEYEPPLL